MNPNRSYPSLIFGIATTLLGLTVIAGWYLKNPSLIQINPDFAPMQYNTALGFMLSGLGLFFFNLEKLKSVRILGSLTVLLGGLTLVQYIFGVDLGIDQFFMEAYITVKTSHPGRMAPNTAVCFTISGIALLVFGSSLRMARKLAITSILTTLLLILSASAFLGYMMGQLEMAYGWGKLTRMAIHTSLSFIFITIGLTTLIWQKSKAIRTEYSGFQITLAICIVIFISVLMAVAQHSNDNKLIKKDTYTKAKTIKNKLSTHLHFQSQALIRMAERWAVKDNTDRQALEIDAKKYIEDFPGYASIQWVDAELNSPWIIPPLENNQSVTPELSIEQKEKLAFQKARETKNIWVSESFDAARFGEMLFTIVPIYSKDRFQGFIVVRFSTKQLLTTILKQKHIDDLSFQIYENEKLLLQFGKSNEPLKNKFGHREDILYYNIPWTFHFWPNEVWLKAHQSYLPLITVFIGLFMSYALGSAIHFYHQTSKEKDLVEKIKQNNELILKSAGEGIFGLNMDGKTTFANPAAEKMLGYKEKELLGKLQHALIHHSKPDGSPYPRGECHIYATFADGKVHRESEEVFWRKDGTSFPVEYISTPIHENENVVGAVVTFNDISKRKKVERLISEFTQNMKQANDNLFRSNKELDDFAYIVSHDLKEPLRGIYNYSEFIKEDYSEILDDDGKSKLDTLIRLSQRMELLINNVLKYARFGRSEINLKPTDLNKTLIEVLDNLQFLQSESRVDIRIPKPLPVVTCDEVWVSEVLQNLIVNAMKYNDKEDKWVEVGYLPQSASGNGSSLQGTNKNNGAGPVFYVRDNGIGIPEKFHDSLFRIFKRLNGKKKFGEGAGAGTTIAKKVIERHNGKIWVKSTEGQGTTFYFTLGGEHHYEPHQVKSLDSVG